MIVAENLIYKFVSALARKYVFHLITFLSILLSEIQYFRIAYRTNVCYIIQYVFLCNMSPMEIGSTYSNNWSTHR